MKKAALLLVFFLFFGKISWAGKKPLIVASIFPLAEMAKEVGGEGVKVRLLLPPGADPHSWEPTPRDILVLREAVLLLAVGGGLEPWLDDILSGLERPPQVLRLIPENSSPGDPHVWLDFLRDAEFCRKFSQRLAELFPQKAAYFLKRGEKVRKRFLKLHEEFAQTLKKCKFRLVPLAGHKAFSAWEKNYGLTFVTLTGPNPEAEPTPKALQNLISLVRKNGLKAVYYDEPRARRFAALVARETGAQIYYLTPGASPTREELSAGLSFLDLMRRNLRHLRLGLSCPNH